MDFAEEKEDDLEKASAQEDLGDYDLNVNPFSDHPMFKKNPTELTYLANLFKNQSNSAAEFDCMSEGDPLWDVVWRKMPENKNMTNVKTKRYANKLYSNLTFKLVTPEDQGTYICQVVGQNIIVKKVNLIVKSKKTALALSSVGRPALLSFTFVQLFHRNRKSSTSRRQTTAPTSNGTSPAMAAPC